MSHLRVNSSESSPISQIREKCCNATTLKISLLVFGLLLTAGAIAVHLYQVNAIAVYTMGSVSGLLIFSVAIASIIQCIRKRHSERERESQDFQACMLGMDVSRLPQSVSERRQVIERKRQEKLEEAIQQSVKTLDAQIVSMRQCVEKFGKIINDSNEPLEIQRFFGLIRGTFNGNHQEKINFFWSNLKLLYAFQSLGSSFLSLGGLDKNETISQKQQEITGLRNQLLQLRQASYHGFIQPLGREELLKEAQENYVKSFSQEERIGIKDSVEQMTLETILPKLKERVLAQAKNDYDIVEMQEIISQIERV